MSKLFGSINEVDSHNNSMNSGLALENILVTHCAWIRLFMIVAMGMTITN